MSSHPGECTVRAFVTESWSNLSPEMEDFIVAVYEGTAELREYIESKMSDYDPDTSWRTYRNAMLDTIETLWPDVERTISEKIMGPQPEIPL